MKSGVDWFQFCFACVSLVSSSTPVTISPSTKSFTPPLAPHSWCTIPCLGYPHNNSSDLFQAWYSPKAFSLLPLLRSITFLSRMIFPRSTPYTGLTARIGPLDSCPAPKDPPQRSKHVQIVRPPPCRFGIEMPRTHLCAMPVVSLTFHFIPVHMECLSP